ncbi:hypothetical protein LINGRAHAP2_LOCUS3641 [Linum grandiflorum]
METNDPFASTAPISRVASSPESQFSSSDPNSGDDLGPGELSSGSAATTSETDHGSGDDNLFLTPPEASFSVSDNEVFHTPTRASSSVPSSQEAPQPEQIINGGIMLEESVGDSEETVVPISVDLDAEADLSSSGDDSLVDYPDGVDRTPENEVIQIHCESVRSRVSEVESVLVEKSDRSELSRTTRIVRLKESLQKLKSLSEKQDNRKASLDNENCSSQTERLMDCEENLFISSGMNVILPVASIEKNSSKVDDGRFHSGKRKLSTEFEMESDSEENIPVLEYILASLEHTDEFKQACNNGEDADADADAEHIPPVEDNENHQLKPKPVKKARVWEHFTALDILRMVAEQESDHHHGPRFEATSLVEIAKIRGMTFP